MSSSSQQKINSYLAGGNIAKGKAVKFGADSKHVVQATAATDKIIGIAQSDATAELMVEVAKPGGGGFAKLGGNVAGGDLLTSDANGDLVATTTANNRVIAMADEFDGAAGDIVAVEVIAGIV